MSRTNSSIRNTFFALQVSLAMIPIGLIAQRVFIDTLGAEYLGINSLFTSIVSMLALVELGLGSAIYYHLYKPVANGDVTKIKSLVNFYKKGYRLIAGIVFVLGLCMLPLLTAIVGDVNISENIYVIYLLFLADIVLSYLLIHKRAVLYVDQNNHIISKVHLAYLIIMNTAQITALLTTGNFYLYLVIKIVMRLVENIVLTFITNRKYPYLKDGKHEELDRKTRSDIFKKVRGLSYHKVATYVVLGTDSIIISIFFGIATVGLYSNYLLVIGAISMIIYQIFTAITASIGNLLVNSKSNKSFEVYKRMLFGNFWLATFATTSLLVIMNSFITIWIGEQYLLPLGVLVAICLSLYMMLIRSTMNSFKEAAGIFHQDRFVPVVESVANIVFSLVLLHYFGLAGVFLGTAFSTLIPILYSYPKYVYEPLFEQPRGTYYGEFFRLFFIALVVAAITFAMSRTVSVEGNFASFALNVLLCLALPNAMLYVLYKNSPELLYYKLLYQKTALFAKK